MAKKKNPAAVALGKLGGKAPKSKPYGFASMKEDTLQRLSLKGVLARGDQIRKQLRSEFASRGGKARAESLTPDKRRDVAKQGGKKRWAGRPSVVYFATNQSMDEVKIGSTTNLVSRLRSLHCNPNNRSHCGGSRAILVAAFHDKGQFDEFLLQERFANSLIGNEWFEVSSNIVKFLKGNKNSRIHQPDNLEEFLQANR